MQLLFRKSHQQGVQAGDGKQAVSQNGNMEMDFEQGLSGMRQDVVGRKKQWRCQADGSERQHKPLQALKVVSQAGQPIDRDGHPGDGRQCLANAEMQTIGLKNALIQDVGVEQQRQQNGRFFPGKRGRASLLRMPDAAPEIGSQPGIQQGGNEKR